MTQFGKWINSEKMNHNRRKPVKIDTTFAWVDAQIWCTKMGNELGILDNFAGSVDKKLTSDELFQNYTLS